MPAVMPGNTQFIRSSPNPWGPYTGPDLSPVGGAGFPSNSMFPPLNDYYPVGGGPTAPGESVLGLRQIKAARRLWDYEDQVFRPVLQKCLAAWAQYNNIYDTDAGKDDWQSKKATPFMFITLERLAGAFTQFIEQRPGWFNAEASIPPMQLFVDMGVQFLDWWLNHDMVDFFSAFEETMKSGLMTGHCHVTITVEIDNVELRDQQDLLPVSGQEDFTAGLWSELSPFLGGGNGADGKPPVDPKEFPFLLSPNMPKLCFKVIPTTNVRLDSSGAERYKMWKSYMGVGEFFMTAGKKGWNMEACKNCIGGHSTQFEAEINRNAMMQGIVRNQEPTSHTVELLHFEGYLHDPENGEPLFDRKMYMVIANDRRIVYGPAPIPFWDEESVMVSAPFIKNAGAVYGRSFLPESVDMMDLRHDLMNVLLDYIRMVLQSPIQVNRDLLEDRTFRDEFTLYPNKVINIRGEGNADAIRRVQTPDLPVGFWQFLQHFQQNQQEMTGMSQELMGSPKGRIRTTGMENDARQAQAGKFLEAIWAGIERRLLRPLLRKAYLRLLQYIPDAMWKAWILSMQSRILPTGQSQTDPNVIAAWKDQITKCADWDARTRYKYLGSFFRWKVNIFNNLNQRQTDIEKITMLLNVLQKIPGAFQVMRLEVLINKLAIAFGWDPAEILDLKTLPQPNADAMNDMDPQSMFNTIMNGGGDSSPIQAPNLLGDTNDLSSMLDAYTNVGGFGSPPPPGTNIEDNPGGPTSPSPNFPANFSKPLPGPQ